MPDQTRTLIQRHWQLANARRWREFSELVAADLRYEVPQTGEYIDSGPGYCEMFSTWPGDWQATITELICERHKAVCVIDFDVDGTHMTGLSIFELQDGRIAKVTDYWPEPYEPPPRATPHMKRRPRAG